MSEVNSASITLPRRLAEAIGTGLVIALFPCRTAAAEPAVVSRPSTVPAIQEY